MQTLDNIIGPAVRILRIAGIVLVAGVLSSLFISTEPTARLLLSIAQCHSWTVPKVAASIVVATNWRPIFGFIRKRVLRRGHLFLMDLIFFVAGSSDVPSECLEDVPRTEILDHLFRNKTFLRDQAEVAFRLPRYRVTALKQNLERVGVLVRGPNNAHVLNPAFSRQDVAAVLESSTTAAGLQPLFRKNPDGSFTSKPSAAEIKGRVEDDLQEPNPPLSKAPGFKNVILATRSCAADVQRACNPCAA